MNDELKVAFVSGSAYDPLYSCLSEFTEKTGIKVTVTFSGNHAALNQHLAALPEVPYHLISTHSKYAPSQLGFLAPLDGLVDSGELADFMPRLLELTSINGSLYGLPRNIDVRLLHYRTDLIASAPKTWDELFDLARRHNLPPDFYGFAFPGCESGLFGTFYELAEMAGACLFPADLVPDIENEAGRWALGLLRKFYVEGIVPKAFTNWHFDQVHECFRSGHTAMIGDFPGYYSLHRDERISAVHNRLGLSLYPVGPSGKSLAYGGSHTFALTQTGGNNPQALELLLFLTAFEQQLSEARNGSVPVRQTVMRQMQSEADASNYARLTMLENVIAGHILIPPKFALYPKVEEVLWRTVQRAIVGQMTVDTALHYIREQIKQIVRPDGNVFRGTKKRTRLTLQTRLS